MSEAVGIFDSGLGGLFAVRELFRRRARTDVIYYADEAYLPYGEKPPDLLLARARAITRGLRARGASTLLAACGTLSSVAVPRLREECPLPLYGITEPLAQKTAQAVTAGGEILLLATDATVRAGLFSKQISVLATHAPLHTQACPTFVPLVEGWRARREEEILRALREALAPYLALPIAAVALGCTHFSPLGPYISRLFPAATVVDGARESAAAFAAALSPQLAPGEGRLRILTSGDPRSLAHRIDPHLFASLPPYTIEKTDFL